MSPRIYRAAPPDCRQSPAAHAQPRPGGSPAIEVAHAHLMAPIQVRARRRLDGREAIGARGIANAAGQCRL